MKELLQQIGKERLLKIEQLSIKVKVLDVRKAFGRTDFLITPLAGTGTQWVSEDRLNK